MIIPAFGLFYTYRFLFLLSFVFGPLFFLLYPIFLSLHLYDQKFSGGYFFTSNFKELLSKKN